MKRISRYLPILLALFALPLVARAQGPSFDVGVGFGTNYDKANAGGYDNANSENAYGPCTPNTGDTDCDSNPALRNFSLGFSGDAMFRKNLGFGADAIFQPAQSAFGPFNTRQSFYDFDVIFAPINEKRVSLKLAGGIGGARTSVYVPVSTPLGGNSSELYNENSHFALHASAGVQIYVTEHVFIRPQFDYRYIPNFNEEYGSNSEYGGSVWVGYSFGDR